MEGRQCCAKFSGFSMRNFVGWRYIIAIVLPLLLATTGVISLTTDLLNQVAGQASRAENLRNRGIAVRLLKGVEGDMLRLVRQNAQWDDATRHVYPVIDHEWMRSTWGSINSIGHSYDRAAVFEGGNAVALAFAGGAEGKTLNLESYLGDAFAPLQAKLSGTASSGPVTSFANTPDGPAVVAAAPIAPGEVGKNQPQRYLAFVNLLNERLLATGASNTLVQDLRVVPASEAGESGLVVNGLGGKAVFGLAWSEGKLGAQATSLARQKAALALGFLTLVMTGIGFVCWRLVQNLVSNEEKAVHQALHDSLTEMPNRAAMIERLKTLRANGTPHLIAYADLDGFKEVNDSYGHQVGDRLLCAVGAGIMRLSGNAAMASRMGGDEFVVLFEGADARVEADKFTGMLLRFLAKPFDIDGRIAYVGASIGVAQSEQQDTDEVEILRRADIAMYKAKLEGKNRSCVYDVSFDAERADSLAIAGELRGIIRNRSLDVVFQPVISTRDMRVSGVEALARWPKDSTRSVAPDRFIAVAESAGLIDDLGELMLDKACAAARNWPELRLAVNISAVQLNNPRFVDRALAIIDSHRIPPRRLEFEITETSLIRDADRAKLVFKELQRYGIKVALDDFGTGFSSIGYLRTFHFDRIKIDKSIISKVLSNPAELAIVQGTLLVARGLSAEVTAEGVERQEEVSVLKLAGCTELQGYHFHKPIAEEDLTSLLAARRQPDCGRKLA
jgi:diguanylate cyclase (GGDEF)-like protein